jgi:16S rRNA (guanine966-N2)-methyltransferase
MRIIAGTFKGRRLADLGQKCKDIRPTSDMTREALFSILERWPKGPFLDIFSGTGAVALEAASRGYSPVWCLEADGRAVEHIRANGKGAGLNIVHKDARKIKDGEFGGLAVIFADPPFVESLEMWNLLAERLASFLAPSGILVWECPKKTDLSDALGLSMVDKRTYSAAKLTFFENKNLKSTDPK